MTPIDEVRRITNFSTGALGVQLANTFAAAGHAVICLLSTGATCTDPLAPTVTLTPFETNADVVARCEELARAGTIDLVLHAAALGDYEVGEVRDGDGRLLRDKKIPSRVGELHVTLRPAVKVIPRMRAWFPDARIAGWKYELEGTRADALAAGVRQIREAETDACIVNGLAYGAGFGRLDPDGHVEHFADRTALGRGLLAWAGE